MTDVPATAIARQRAQCVERVIETAGFKKVGVGGLVDRWFEMPEWERRFYEAIVLCGGGEDVWRKAVEDARGGE
jgi:hypothetical protein